MPASDILDKTTECRDFVNFKSGNQFQVKSEVYKCSFCFYVTERNYDIQEHLLLHKKYPPFICDICKKSFTQKCNLKTHLRLHSDERPYICKICKKAFKQKKNLDAHLVIHTDICLYRCSVCGEKFRQKIQVQNHHLRHHTVYFWPHFAYIIFSTFFSALIFSYLVKAQIKLITSAAVQVTQSYFVGVEFINKRCDYESEVFRCPSCFYVTERNCDLQAHLLVHQKYSYICDTCNRPFIRRDYLKLHLRIHSGERPYICEVCNRGFTQKSALNTHLRIHTNEYPYQCTICGKKYRHKIGLKKHHCVEW
ncbi:zinc finger protein 585A-like [Stegodyphus dumicola]|uniref:zinc finger protein 585A-like n=1 Tax=Stegodyphus dumicola TaxID=202533 RepID=UPI0015AB105B|nr:zinc finger protein 585A-like [Stegodyphus dumicola]